MSLPAKLKNMNLFEDGTSYIGQVPEVTLPTLKRMMEDYRGAGMDSAIKVDMGGEPMELGWTAGGLIVNALRNFGATRHDAVLLRFAGAYQRDDTGLVEPVEIVVRGRHEEIELGKAKPGDDTEMPIKTTCSYFKLIINGRTEIEIDVMNMIFIVDGVDRLAAQRAAIGV